MKDPTDTKTADLLLPKKRGRPPTGAAMTPAQRKREQRARDRAAVLGDREEVDTVTVTGLVEAIGRYAGRGNADLVEVLARDLVARIRAAQADKPRLSRLK